MEQLAGDGFVRRATRDSVSLPGIRERYEQCSTVGAGEAAVLDLCKDLFKLDATQRLPCRRTAVSFSHVRKQLFVRDLSLPSFK